MTLSISYDACHIKGEKESRDLDFGWLKGWYNERKCPGFTSLAGNCRGGWEFRTETRDFWYIQSKLQLHLSFLFILPLFCSEFWSSFMELRLALDSLSILNSLLLLLPNCWGFRFATGLLVAAVLCHAYECDRNFHRNRGGAVVWMGFPKKVVKSPCGHAKKSKDSNTCQSSKPEYRLWRADAVRQEAGGAQFRNSLHECECWWEETLLDKNKTSKNMGMTKELAE